MGTSGKLALLQCCKIQIGNYTVAKNRNSTNTDVRLFYGTDYPIFQSECG